MTHYDNLGLAVTASDDEITDAYRALVKVVHPDMGGDAVMFGILTESFDVLSDAAQRAAYDRQLMETIEKNTLAVGDAVADNEPLSLFDTMALDSYNRNRTESVATGCLTDALVTRFFLFPAVMIGVIVMAVPFWPVRLLGAIVVLVGLASPLFVRYGAHTTRKKQGGQARP